MAPSGASGERSALRCLDCRGWHAPWPALLRLAHRCFEAAWQACTAPHRTLLTGPSLCRRLGAVPVVMTADPHIARSVGRVCHVAAAAHRQQAQRLQSNGLGRPCCRQLGTRGRLLSVDVNASVGLRAAGRFWCAPHATRSTLCTWATRRASSRTTLCSSMVSGWGNVRLGGEADNAEAEGSRAAATCCCETVQRDILPSCLAGNVQQAAPTPCCCASMACPPPADRADVEGDPQRVAALLQPRVSAERSCGGTSRGLAALSAQCRPSWSQACTGTPLPSTCFTPTLPCALS